MPLDFFFNNNTAPLSIERGTPGAFKCEFTLCDKEDLFLFHDLFEMQISQNVSVSELCETVAERMRAEGKGGDAVDVGRLRLRDRLSDHPGKIFHREGAVRDYVTVWRDGMQIAVEMLDAPEELVPGQLGLYVQRWNPSSFTVGPRAEVAVSEKATLVEMKEIFAAHSGIAAEDLEVLHCNMFNGLDLLELPREKWEDLAKKKPYTSYSNSYSSPAPGSQSCTVGASPWYCKDGALFLIKDTSEQEKSLTMEDKKKLASGKVYSGRKTSYMGGSMRRAERGVHIDVQNQVKRRPSVEDAPSES